MVAIRAEKLRRQAKTSTQPPSTAKKGNWPPDYISVRAWRAAQCAKFELDAKLAASALSYYSSRPVEFINHWCETFDPRNVGTGTPTNIPLIMFERQEDLVWAVLGCLDDKESGLTEKSRDMGASWICCALSVWLWRFRTGTAIGWGSRKAEYVDKIGDPKSIFWKIRYIIDRLPSQFLPAGYRQDVHATYMKIINPANGATITGEAGDNIGRGGRTSIYFKDESAHYEKPALIEAALMDNTDVQIDISSVNGIGNVFHRRREAGVEWERGKDIPPGKTRVFILDWRHHPAKDDAWYERRRQKAIDDGLEAEFAQEVDRDYAASRKGVLIKPAWVKAAIDAHIKLGFDDRGKVIAGLDVADDDDGKGDQDKNAMVVRKGVVAVHAEDWGNRDTTETTEKAVDIAAGFGPMEIHYDCIGVGAGVKGEANRMAHADELPHGLEFIPWSASAAVLEPESRVVKNTDGSDDNKSPTNKDFFQNFKAQAWWSVRERFRKTFRAVREGAEYPPDELISLSSDLPNLHQLERELSQATRGTSGRGLVMINKSPEGTRSPNMADALVQSYFPARKQKTTVLRF